MSSSYKCTGRLFLNTNISKTTGLCECRPDENGETTVAADDAAVVAAAEKNAESRPEVRQIDIGKEAAMEAEVKAARERAIIPLEIRMKQFRDMLSEKEVTVRLLCF